MKKNHYWGIGALTLGIFALWTTVTSSEKTLMMTFFFSLFGIFVALVGAIKNKWSEIWANISLAFCSIAMMYILFQMF